MRLDGWQLQEAIFARLKADPAIKLLKAGVYDVVPTKAKLPFIAFGDETAAAYNTKVSTGETDDITINIWSSYKGKKEAKAIMSAVTSAIYTMPLQLKSGGKVTLLTLSSAQIVQEEADNLFHGIMNFSFTIRH
jgi:hypothetical protein